MCHTEHVFRQGSLPRGGSQSKRDTKRTHRTQTRGTGHRRGAQMVRGATGWGGRHVQASSFWLSLLGKGRRAGRSPGWPYRKPWNPGGLCRGLWSSALGGRGESLSIVVNEERDPMKQRQENEAKSPGGGPELTARGCHLSWGRAVPACRPSFPEPFPQRKSEQRFWQGALLRLLT